MSEQRLPSIRDKLLLEASPQLVQQTEQPNMHDLSNPRGPLQVQTTNEITRKMLRQFKSLPENFTDRLSKQRTSLLPLYGFTEEEIPKIMAGQAITNDNNTTQPQAKKEEPIAFIGDNNMRSSFGRLPYPSKRALEQPNMSYNPLPTLLPSQLNTGSPTADNQLTMPQSTYNHLAFIILLIRSILIIEPRFINTEIPCEGSTSNRALHKHDVSPSIDSKSKPLRVQQAKTQVKQPRKIDFVQFTPPVAKTKPPMRAKLPKKEEEEEEEEEVESPELSSDEDASASPSTEFVPTQPLRRSRRARKPISYRIPKETDIFQSEEEGDFHSDASSEDIGEDEVAHFMSSGVSDSDTPDSDCK